LAGLTLLGFSFLTNNQHHIQKMSNHSFNITPIKENGKIVQVTIGEASTLSEMVEAFEEFLYAVGYRLPDGSHIGFEYDDEIEMAY